MCKQLSDETVKGNVMDEAAEAIVAVEAIRSDMERKIKEFENQ